jgi:hypothetical protein
MWFEKELSSSAAKAFEIAQRRLKFSLCIILRTDCVIHMAGRDIFDSAKGSAIG